MSAVAEQVSSFGAVDEKGFANKLINEQAVNSLVQKADWNVYCWAPSNCSSEHIVGGKGHLSLIFQSRNRVNWKPFTIELVLKKKDKISLYSYIFDEKKKYGLTRKREVLPSKNDISVKYSFIAINKSVDDLENLALDCIKKWRWYSLLFFNCRDFVYRLTLYLQKDSKLFGYLLPYIPVLYDDWFIKFLRASAWGLCYKITYKKGKSVIIYSLKRSKLLALKRSFITMYDITGYILLAQAGWNLTIGSIQLIHQKHELNVNFSSIDDDETDIKSNDDDVDNKVIIGFC